METPSDDLWQAIIEGVLLYIALPLLFFGELVPLPKIVVLIAVAGYCSFRLWRDPSFRLGLFSRDVEYAISKNIVIRTVLIAFMLGGLVWIMHPEQLFAFPIECPLLWVVIMVLYPLLSVLPQEIIFRSYFFHRFEHYLPLKNATVILSALAFAFLHIIYDNWWAIGLSFAGGLLFGFTYKKTKSLYWVTIEHAIYGGLLFTLGMGNYFYEAF
ncbi:CPBP family intramembrane glutamic endopeptidase [Fodinibius saliphilus]|uniref:CPBP family intramembrane glutamic endopeptidase n=1 Tax=Fodinibius saliphilus TaxID=1920650 RepID=UPI001109167A|nr:type II CAAX endopeptidase family protein [Fodinibius saliphilus]